MKKNSVISRELKRNSDGRSGLYQHVLANKKYHQRQKRKYKKFSIPIQQEVERLLRDDYSPEQVVGTLKK